MNTSEIDYLMRKDNICKEFFTGVFPSDKISKLRVQQPFACIVNTDPSTKPGRHWCSIFIDRHGIGEFFDSYGKHPAYYGNSFVDFLNRHSKRWTYNETGLQGPFTATCGQYCVFYLLHRCKGIPLSEIIRTFTKDKALNDEMVNEYVRKISPLETKIYDIKTLKEQISLALM